MSDVLVTTDGHIGTIQIRRPPHNYFDVDVIDAVVAGTAECRRSGARVILLRSEGRSFSAGGNLGGPAAQLDDRAAAMDLTASFRIYELAIELVQQPLPIVAMVQGAAIGGGLGLAMAADFRVASSEAWFSANFARLGFHHGFALSVTLPPVIGQQRSLEMLYTGRRVHAEEAAGWGLCDVLCQPEELLGAGTAFAEEIARSAPLAVQSIRSTMRSDLVESMRDALRREQAEQLRLVQTRDWNEGIAAASERREPNFEGR